MQYQQYQNHEEDQTDDGLTKNIEERMQLSAAWRALLSLEVSAPAQVAAASTAPVLANDPWSVLLQMQGVQVIDLQQFHAQTARSILDEREVELALDNIQEQQA